MLPRKKLIALRQEFPEIRKIGKVYDSVSFGLVVSFGKIAETQCAFVVSKKISLKSVVRHEVKRKLAEAVTPLLARLPKSAQLVFLAKKRAVETSKEGLQTETEEALRRARLL